MTRKPPETEPVGQDAGPEPDGPLDERAADAKTNQPDPIRPGDKPDELLVFDHGFVRLDDAMADDLSVVNGARVSFAVRKEVMDDRDKGLIRFLMRDRHGSPFEHNSFRFHIRAPIFVAREWFRHRVGCLTGDTEVTFVDTNGHATPKLRKTMEDLWRMWSIGERNGHALSEHDSAAVERIRQSGGSLRATAREARVGRRGVTRHLREGSTTYRGSRSRVRRMRLRILNEDSCEFDIGHVVDVVDSGMQPVYRLNLQDGKSVRLTANHRVLTERGWKSLREAVGLSGSGPHAVMTRPCSLITNGEPAHRNRVWLEKQRRSGASVAEMAGSAGCSYHTMRKWLRRHGLQFSLEERGFPKGQVPWNTARPVRVVACEYVGVEQTYDLCVDGPWHNFVANGIVVHNSFNEESARYHKLASDFYVPARGAVRTQVGKPGSYSFEPVDEAVADDARDTFARVYKQLYAEYQALLDKGVAKELARSLLPFGIYTQFYWTLNARSLMNFLSLRNSDDAQYEIRTYAEAVERLFAQKMPVTYECFVEFERKVP